MSNSEAAFFVPATPSLPDGSFSNEYLLAALRSVAQQVRAQKKRDYLFVVNSTVTPGSCDNVFRPLLEEALQARCGADFGLCYNPEFIALGNVISGLLEPDFVLIGESDARSGARLEGVYRRLCAKGAPVERMSNLNAELAKISVNCAVTMKISFVNQLSAVCAKLPGADARVILHAIGKDRRIGSDYLRPGLGYGGPCFPRDNSLFQYTARAVGVEASLADATDRINQRVNERLLQTVRAHAPNGAPVAVLGLAYKPFTNVIDASPGIWLCQQLAAQGHRVLAHDYAAAGTAARVLTGEDIHVVSDPREALRESKIVAITCPWPAYRALFQRAAAETVQHGTIIVDPWAFLAGLDSSSGDVSLVTRLL